MRINYEGLLNAERVFWYLTFFRLVFSSCYVMSVQNRIVGAGCAWDNPLNHTGVVEHQCVLSCMSDKGCTAVNYDVHSNVFMRMSEPCPVIETQPLVNYLILASPPNDECVQWIATHDWNYHRMVKVSMKSNFPLGVARIVTTAGDVLPAKWPHNQNRAFTIKTGSVVYNVEFEALVVNQACSLQWVYYDASSDNPLPIGAIRGGQWADGIPLYVSVIYARDDRRVIGYYNHEIRMGTCDYMGAECNKRDMDILVVVWNEALE